jgi:hypothetical protein
VRSQRWPWLRAGRKHQESDIKSVDALGTQYLRELRDLLDDGEIDSGLAQRILDDLFEEAEPGLQPRLKASIWLAYLDQKRRLAANPGRRRGNQGGCI